MKFIFNFAVKLITNIAPYTFYLKNFNIYWAICILEKDNKYRIPDEIRESDGIYVAL